MKRIEYICDHCGKTFKKTEGCINFDLTINYYTATQDLCDACFDKLCAIIHNFFKEEFV